MEWISHTCSTCRYADNPHCIPGGSTMCNRYKNDLGAQIIIYGREMQTHVCDAWTPRARTDQERMDDYRAESIEQGFNPVDVRTSNNVVYGVYTADDVHRLYALWSRDRANAPAIVGICCSSAPVPRVDAPDVPVYTVFDNTDGNLWMEDYFSENIAIEWLTGDYVDVDALHISDAIYIKEQLQRGGYE